MTTPLNVPEYGRAVWVFAIDLPDTAIAAFQAETYSDHGELRDWPLCDALGLDWLDHDFIEVFEAQTMQEYGFARYLTEANGLDEDAVGADADQLNALTGHVLLVFSDAVRSKTLSPKPPLRLIGHYPDANPIAPMDKLYAKSAQGNLSKPAKKVKSDAAIGGKIALYAMIVMFAIVGMMIWVAG
ncbi:hypothetical protein [Aestuariibius sp. HNIBRBA575]|uniref:hypothetical protein n=1 Tax=Aestuariibius sp. HNIBRBA575 TaxID=3233343 RepID=UPI0034A4C8B4